VPQAKTEFQTSDFRLATSIVEEDHPYMPINDPTIAAFEITD